MKKQLLTLAALFVAGSILFVSCKKDDTTAPVITLKGDATANVDFNATYTDAGATASDDTDGDISSAITVTNNVKTNSAETYHVMYEVKDKAGNVANGDRTVNVVMKGASMVATYAVTDVVGSTSSPYSDNITSSSSDPNKFLCSKFAYYTNGGVYFTLSGTNGLTVALPSQVVVCGNPSASRTFTGSGSVTKDGKTITVNYTEATNGTSTTGVETYTKQ